MVISHDRQSLYVLNRGTNKSTDNLAVIDMGRNALSRTIPIGQAGTGAGIVLSRDDREAYLASNPLVVVDTSGAQGVRTVSLGSDFAAKGIAISPDGNRLYVLGDTGNATGRVAILDTATKSLSDAVPITIAPNTVAITPDGQKLLIGGSSTDLVIVDTQTDVVSGAVSPFPSVLAVAFSPDGARTYALADAAVGVINTATNRLLLTIDLSAGFGHLAVAADGKILATTNSEGGISIVDTIANTLLTTLPFRAGDIVIAGFPCGQVPATATPTEPIPPSPTPTPPLKPCIGDCNGDGEVPVNELITMVNIALGTANVSSCTVGDADGSGDITINEIIAAVNNALTGCPAS
jgi:dipeptidyl aminopeptidase/acylaminoacyl peptidase